MSKLFFLAIFIYISASLTTTEGVQCYQCAYIEGIEDLNPDCLHHVISGSVQIGGGLACLRAEGVTSGGQRFIIRRSFRPNAQSDLTSTFPMGQSALTCEEAGNYGNKQVTKAALSVTIIGDQKVREVTSCLLCNDRDECNGGINVKEWSSFIFTCVATSLALSWFH